MALYSHLIRPFLFALPPETAHTLAVECCRLAGAMPLLPGFIQSRYTCAAAELESEVAGIRFSNPIGLAAGWDKSGRAVSLLDCLGFGFAEIGSISANPSAGNPKPRLFRLPGDQALVVNYGLPNEGAERVARRIAQASLKIPLGVNIVSTNFGPDTPLQTEEEIITDYKRSATLLHQHADYLALNLSCPNAEGGKDIFAQKGNLTRLLQQLQSVGIECPVFLKLAPIDDPETQENWLTEVETFSFVRGFQFNLPPGKYEALHLKTPRSVWGAMPGAVSGRPVEELINRCIAGLFSLMDRKRYSIIAAGGVFSAEQAYRKIKLGASLVQVYTALVYEGPSVVRKINAGLVELLQRDGFARLQDAVGTEE